MRLNYYLPGPGKLEGTRDPHWQFPEYRLFNLNLKFKFDKKVEASESA